VVKVSQKQKELVDDINSITNEFMDRFTYKAETGYFIWNDNLRIGDVVDFVHSKVNERRHD
jgi:hypothetical protein